MDHSHAVCSVTVVELASTFAAEVKTEFKFELVVLVDAPVERVVQGLVVVPEVVYTVVTVGVVVSALVLPLDNSTARESALKDIMVIVCNLELDCDCEL